MSKTVTASVDVVPAVVKTNVKDVVHYFDPKAGTDGAWQQNVKNNFEELPIFKIITVTPSFCKEALEKRNFVNRPLRSDRIQQYVKDMRNNNWFVATNDIGFYEDGTLAEGQHRLKAVVEIGKPVKMGVKFGISPDAAIAIDVGRPRSNGDVLKTLGVEDIHAKHLAATNYILEFRGEKYTSPKSEQYAFCEKHLEAARFACQLQQKYTNTNCIHAPIVGAWYYYANEIDSLQRFIDIVNSTITKHLDDSDDAAIKFRDYLLSHNTKGIKRDGTWRKNTYLMTEHCISFFMDGKKLKTKEPRMADRELFPLPEFGGKPRQANVTTKP